MSEQPSLDEQQIRRFMQLAIDQAMRGMQAGQGGPFGACIVKADKVIACLGNTVLKDADPTAHAEINAIRAAARQLNRFHLKGCVMFSTSLPCPMCTGAIYWAHLSAVYFGCGDELAAKAGFADADIYHQLAQPPHARTIPFTGNILADRCAELFQQWSTMTHKTRY